ncbi:MAG TPA: PilT/PilU family type 4a pilus ATPase [Candidatus Hydrogenedentes bacterium]|nr:PilT/PilU family type 4a pilus ATPase [Candidatus Hydrogenedentota bacterium]HQE83354.1 PilT/PilU family type 4a pilus ATPase [Candidatus Hydrogenedentota bacterium]HQH54333.1 PilT/PilU family type 4a pilus ATPase [Candidatus Hydrogenedentota bacterium]HQM49626.1 PilT/PilU family type 4a pilus ATPase [Candidatus Hydrogenedentota bacterium]
MRLYDLLQQAVEANASDLHLKTDNPPILRIDGDLTRLEGSSLTKDDIMKMLAEIVPAQEVEKFKKVKELDTSYMLKDIARFRVNACFDDGDPRLVFRTIPLNIKEIDQLGLPPILHKVCQLMNGLVLFTGVTGSGKSTSLAAMVDEINRTRPVHTITVEDPMEFLHRDKIGIVTQREVGQDTLSFANALRGALRQDPDVILIGEMRDAETVRTALSSAETGHLVFSTLHTVNSVETLNRIMDFFEPHQQPQIRKQLASVMRAICSQRLLQSAEGYGRCVAAEILVGNRTVREYIEQGKSFNDITKLIEDGYEQYGMQTFDQALFNLWKDKKIDAETALENSTSPRDLKLRMEGFR